MSIRFFSEHAVERARERYGLTLSGADMGEIIRAERREHSRKPVEQYSRIEQLFAGPYIELFSREQRRGWSSWGQETGKFSEVA